MALIDENGDLFGRWNAVDTIAIVLVGLVLIAGVVAGGQALRASQAPSISTQVVQVRATGQTAEIASAIQTGPVATPGIVEVVNKTGAAENGNRTVVLDVRLRIETGEDGLVRYEGERLYIGRELTLALDSATVTGVVVGAREPETLRATPTASPTPSPTASPTPSPAPTVTSPGVETETIPSETTPSGEIRAPSTLNETTHLVRFEAVVSPDTIEDLAAGSVSTADDLDVKRLSAVASGDVYRLRMTVELRVRTSSDGAVYYRGVQLVEGQSLVLDLGEVVVIATVTSL